MNHFRQRLFGRTNKELAKLKLQKLLDGANKPLLALDLLDEQHLTPFYGIDFAWESFAGTPHDLEKTK
jgi:hypothetical protein